ncbi:sulfotransferase [Synechococcus sp. 1G10]|uniref:sulfotransferase family protein n=1 Tax=Synechococcus sp. 1G10 TaxID=2025605 RepID=UPI0013033D8B|nr:sulfotransferase [Synechococcus sp. 1G10]
MEQPLLPHFLVVGAQKAGTSTVHRRLGNHPGIFLPPAKELHYFSLHTDRPWGWYLRQFEGRGDAQLCGEVTPYYLFHPQAPARIRAALPAVRLVVLLRDPVERTLSQYFHARRHGFETLSLEAALKAEHGRLADAEAILQAAGSSHYSHQKHSYVARSRYEQQLDRIEALFPPQQVLVLQSEPLLSGKREPWERLYAFLGVPPVSWEFEMPRENAGLEEAKAVQAHVKELLRRQLEISATAVRKRYGFDWGW